MSVDTEKFSLLSADFPKEDIHWRAQTLTKNGDKALALAYLDARNVMDRLDEICGPENWQDRYEVHGSKTICYLSIKIGNEWITKSDGAGDTAVEAEKGSLSDAFKRSAVKWGVGRYLYSLDAVWCPCKTYTSNGKVKFSNFTADPWDYVRGAAKPKPNKSKIRENYTQLLDECKTKQSLETLAVFVKSTDAKEVYMSLDSEWKKTFNDELSRLKTTLSDSKMEAAE